MLLEVVETTALKTFLAQDFPSSRTVAAWGGTGHLGPALGNCFSLPELLPVQSHNHGADVEAC